MPRPVAGDPSDRVRDGAAEVILQPRGGRPTTKLRKQRGRRGVEQGGYLWALQSCSIRMSSSEDSAAAAAGAEEVDDALESAFSSYWCRLLLNTGIPLLG